MVGVVLFGIGRGWEVDSWSTGIETEANMAMAEHRPNTNAEKAATNFAWLRIIITHRIGFVKIAEPSLFLRVESAHRSAVLSASVWIIDELKQRVPIWKRPVFAAGGKHERENKKVAALPTESSLRA